MADDSFNDGRASEEPYTRIRTLGRGAFGEAVLYRKTEVSFSLKLSWAAAREIEYSANNRYWAPRKRQLPF